SGLAGAHPDLDGARLTVPLARGAVRLADVVRELDRAGVTAEDVGLRRPTLDEVFLRLTGRDTDPAAPADDTTAHDPQAGDPAGRQKETVR
ncbi:hypothetical protein ABZ914_51595, partial [Spirillospora sp. NPDC046719]